MNKFLYPIVIEVFKKRTGGGDEHGKIALSADFLMKVNEKIH